jgi:hypothetical protein
VQSFASGGFVFDISRRRAHAAAAGWVMCTSTPALREKLMKERAERPRDPKAYTAIDLNPDFQARMKSLLARVAPGGTYDPANVGEYVENFKKAVVTDPQVTFTVKGEFDGRQIKLSGETSDRTYHDRLIDLLVAMKLYNISNGVQFARAPS